LIFFKKAFKFFISNEIRNYNRNSRKRILGPGKNFKGLFHQTPPLKKENSIRIIDFDLKWSIGERNSKITLQEGVNKVTRAFEFFIDLGGPIQDQMIRNKKKQKMIAIIRAIKFQI